VEYPRSAAALAKKKLGERNPILKFGVGRWEFDVEPRAAASRCHDDDPHSERACGGPNFKLSTPNTKRQNAALPSGANDE
jgi:hypothetical protein